ncbi:SHOCT domain-containing protein [Micromonospora sp. PLK6-60]|uniref:SHOCT domain-containing protein n=1 Tax=Micromonospora sp. PLK6-60 TaxID=2873383 RepID=UPI001CA7AAF4|nr:SHOCT domain-containing protein [Micromonospora sp. PLK6-60]MBY8870661.1 SHOCT domain-containing protein [Micromonospora sp. PLK6-60]
MMYGYGPGGLWMTLVPVLWLALGAGLVWALLRLVRRPDGEGGRQHRETPQEILDRRFAAGQIDAEEHRRARAQLAGRDAGAP